MQISNHRVFTNKALFVACVFALSFVGPSSGETYFPSDSESIIRGLGGKCMDVKEAKTDNGTPIILWDCAGAHSGDWKHHNQVWKLDGTTGQLIGLGGKCLDVKEAKAVNGTPVILWDCHGKDNQKWKACTSGEIVGLGGKCLDVSGGKSNNGSPIVLWDCHGGNNQKWKLEYIPQVVK